jgi:hypothetical protein
MSSGLYQFGNVSPLYADAGCPAQCYSNNEYADLSDYYGAVPIPPSTAIRIYNTPLSVNQKTYEIETSAKLSEQQVQQAAQAAATAQQAAATAQQAAAAATQQYIRMRRGF